MLNSALGRVVVTTGVLFVCFPIAILVAILLNLPLLVVQLYGLVIGGCLALAFALPALNWFASTDQMVRWLDRVTRNDGKPVGAATVRSERIGCGAASCAMIAMIVQFIWKWWIG